MRQEGEGRREGGGEEEEGRRKLISPCVMPITRTSLHYSPLDDCLLVSAIAAHAVRHAGRCRGRGERKTAATTAAERGRRRETIERSASGTSDESQGLCDVAVPRLPRKHIHRPTLKHRHVHRETRACHTLANTSTPAFRLQSSWRTGLEQDGQSSSCEQQRRHRPQAVRHTST